MSPDRYHDIVRQYASLRVAVVGDFCLDRYLEVDPAKQEVSIETGLPVHNVINVRSQPGGAGTILNNLVALGVGKIYPVGFSGEDGEGFELRRALQSGSGVQMDHFLTTGLRRTFTYCKPLIVESGRQPAELSRLDIKNWTPTQASIQERVKNSVLALSEQIDALILLDQVDVPETGVVTNALLETISVIAKKLQTLPIIADSRRGLRGFPPVCFKMNHAELKALTDCRANASLEELKILATALARQQGRRVFVTLSEHGILGAAPDGEAEHVPACPVRDVIDVVGAGDAVTANLAITLAAGATMRESLEIAMSAASIVIHQLGTTGVASVSQIQTVL